MARKNTVHLHWCWHAGPKALRGVTKGISLCNIKGLPADQLTAFTDDATCAECLNRARRKTDTAE